MEFKLKRKLQRQLLFKLYEKHREQKNYDRRRIYEKHGLRPKMCHTLCKSGPTLTMMDMLRNK